MAYGLFGSPAEARPEFDDALEYEYDNRASSCPKSAAGRMQGVLGEGEVACFVNGDDEYIMMWWNADGSRVMGVLNFAASAKPANAVEAWARVISAS